MNVRDIEFEPSVPTAVTKQAKAWMEKERPAAGYVACYAIFNEEGDVDAHNFGACHAGVSRSILKNRCVVATCNLREKNSQGPTKEEAAPFLRWLLDESYMGRFILNRDDFEYCRDVGFLVSADVYTPLMQNVLITTRHFKEVRRPAFLKFAELVEKGVPGDLAYLLTMVTGYSSSMGSHAENAAISSYSGHRAHDLSSSMKTLRNFLVGEMPGFEDDKKKHYRHFTNYVGGKVLFGDKPTGGYDAGRSDFIKELILGDAEFRSALAKYRGEGEIAVYRPPNPFDPAPPRTHLRPDQMMYKEVWDVLVPYLMENKPWLAK